MPRSKPITIAAVLQFLWCACGIVFTLPDLAKGATPQAGGFSGYMVTVVAFTASVLGIVAVVGAWMNTKWGKILAIVVNVFFGFLLLGAVLLASHAVKVAAGAMLVIPTLIIVLLLWRERKPATV